MESSLSPTPSTPSVPLPSPTYIYCFRPSDSSLERYILLSPPSETPVRLLRVGEFAPGEFSIPRFPSEPYTASDNLNAEIIVSSDLYYILRIAEEAAR